MRISPIIGRKKQMLKFKGTTIYPASVFDVLDNADFVENYYVEVTKNEVGTDNICVCIGTKIQNEDIIKDLKDRFRAKLRVAPEVRFENIDTIQQIIFPIKNRKPTKFFDKR